MRALIVKAINAYSFSKIILKMAGFNSDLAEDVFDLEFVFTYVICVVASCSTMNTGLVLSQCLIIRNLRDEVFKKKKPK